MAPAAPLPTALACPRCKAPLVTLTPGAAVREVSVQCVRCGHWLRLGGRAAGTGLGAVDWIVGAVGVTGGLALVALGVAMRTFKQVFADMGAQVPALTRLVLSAGLPFLLAALAIGLAVAGLALRRTGSAYGRPLLLAAVAVTLVGGPVCLISMYLPIFSLGDAIK